MLTRTPGHLISMSRTTPKRKVVNREKIVGEDSTIPVDLTQWPHTASASRRWGANIASRRGQESWLTRGTLLPPIEPRDRRSLHRGAIHNPHRVAAVPLLRSPNEKAIGQPSTEPAAFSNLPARSSLPYSTIHSIIHNGGYFTSAKSSPHPLRASPSTFAPRPWRRFP